MLSSTLNQEKVTCGAQLAKAQLVSVTHYLLLVANVLIDVLFVVLHRPRWSTSSPKPLWSLGQHARASNASAAAGWSFYATAGNFATLGGGAVILTGRHGQPAPAAPRRGPRPAAEPQVRGVRLAQGESHLLLPRHPILSNAPHRTISHEQRSSPCSSAFSSLPCVPLPSGSSPSQPVVMPAAHYRARRKTPTSSTASPARMRAS